MTGSKSISCNSRGNTDWSELAVSYSGLEEARHELVFPVVREIIRTVGAKTVLDFGCGDGQLLREAVEDGELRQAINYDFAEGMYQLALAGAAGQPKLRVVRSLADVEHGSMDVVTSVAVWMCQPTDDACYRMLRDVSGLLRSGGYFVAAVTHPCFRWAKFSTFKTDFRREDYRRSGTRFHVTLHDKDREVMVTDTHWNLEDMTRQLQGSGFVVLRLRELPDIPDKGPCPWLIIHAQKISG